MAFQDLQLLYLTEGWVPQPHTVRYRLSWAPSKAQRQQIRRLVHAQIVGSAIFQADEVLPAIHFLTTSAEYGQHPIHFLDLDLPQQVDQAKRAALMQASRSWVLFANQSFPPALAWSSPEAFAKVDPRDIAIRARRVPTGFYALQSKFRVNFPASLCAQLAVVDPMTGFSHQPAVLAMYAVHEGVGDSQAATDQVLIHVKTPAATIARQFAAGWRSGARWKNDSSMFTFPLNYAGQIVANDRGFNGGYPLAPPPALAPSVHYHPPPPAPYGGVGYGVTSTQEVKVIEHCPRCGYQKITPPNGNFNPRPIGKAAAKQQKRINGKSASLITSPQPGPSPRLPAHQVPVGPSPTVNGNGKLGSPSAAASTSMRSSLSTEPRTHTDSQSDFDKGRDGDQTNKSTMRDLTVADDPSAQLKQLAPEAGTLQNGVSRSVSRGTENMSLPTLYVNPLYYKLFGRQISGTQQEKNGGEQGSTAEHTVSDSAAVLPLVAPLSSAPEPDQRPTQPPGLFKAASAPLHKPSAGSSLPSNGTIQPALPSTCPSESSLPRLPASSSEKGKARSTEDPAQVTGQLHTISAPSTPSLPSTKLGASLDTFIDEADVKELQEEAAERHLNEQLANQYAAATAALAAISAAASVAPCPSADGLTRLHRLELDEAIEQYEREERGPMQASSPLGSDLDEDSLRTLIVDRQDDEVRPRPTQTAGMKATAAATSPSKVTTPSDTSPASPSGTRFLSVRTKRGRGGRPSYRAISPSRSGGVVPPAHFLSSTTPEWQQELDQKLAEHAAGQDSDAEHRLKTGGPLDSVSDNSGVSEAPKKTQMFVSSDCLFARADKNADVRADDGQGGDEPGTHTASPLAHQTLASSSSIDMAPSSPSGPAFLSSDTRFGDEDDATVLEKSTDSRDVVGLFKEAQPIDGGADSSLIDEQGANEQDLDPFEDAQSYLPFFGLEEDPFFATPDGESLFSEKTIPERNQALERTTAADDQSTQIAAPVSTEIKQKTNDYRDDAQMAAASASHAVEKKEGAAAGADPHVQDYDYELALTLALSMAESEQEDEGPALRRRGGGGGGGAGGGSDEQDEDPPATAYLGGDDGFYTQSGPMDYDLFE